MLVGPRGDYGIGAVDHGDLQIETSSPGHHRRAQCGIGERLPTVVGVLLENGDALETVSRSIIGQRLQRVRQPTGLDALVEGEVRYEVAFGARLRWGKRTDPEVVPEHCHGVEVPADRQVEHRRTRPERGERAQVHRDRRALSGGGTDI